MGIHAEERPACRGTQWRLQLLLAALVQSTSIRLVNAVDDYDNDAYFTDPKCGIHADPSKIALATSVFGGFGNNQWQ